MISLDEPPSSETGSTKQASPKAEQIALPPVPPEITMYEAGVLAESWVPEDDSRVWVMIVGGGRGVNLAGVASAGCAGRSNTEELGLSNEADSDLDVRAGCEGCLSEECTIVGKE